MVGKKNNYNGPIFTPIEDLTTERLPWNSVLSNLNTKYLIVDVNNLYLKNTMNKKEFYKISINLIPQEKIKKRNSPPNKLTGTYTSGWKKACMA